MERRKEYWPVLRRQGARLAGWLVVFLVVIIAAGTVFLGTPFEGSPEAVEGVDADERVSLERTNGGYVLEPTEGESTVGVVFYPGARVEPSAYVASLAPLAAQANVTVVIPQMPLYLAIVDYGVARTGLGTDAASQAMTSRSDVDQWFVGGHSLGGAVACWYADDNAEAVDGLVLYGSYCDRDISERDLAVLSVAGTADTVVDEASYERGLEKLPPDATVVELDGLNHTQFGSYTGQRGDTATGTSYEEAHRTLNEVAVQWFRNQTSNE